MSGTDSRYRPGAEISRRGARVVASGQDLRLDRDVVLTVLENPDDPEAVRRFVAEARLVARLDHPGVAPVYELGVDEAGRPFVASRPVRGQPLRDLVAATSATEGDRSRLLGAFERLCKTMAASHGKGVAHGGLDGTAVQVGEFGEVEVAEWGRASDGGDFAADVRGLGSLLLDVLGPGTGDHGLRDVARRCLSERDNERPTDAGAVADEVSAHLEAARDRAHHLELRAVRERAEAALVRARTERVQVEAAAQRHRTRQIVAFGCAAVVALGAVVVGALWVRSGRLSREDRTRDAVQEVFREVERLRGAARLAEAAQAAVRARALAAGEDASEALRSKAGVLATELANAARAEREEAERARRDADQRRAEDEDRIGHALDGYPGEPPPRGDVEAEVGERIDDLWAHLAAARHFLRAAPEDPRWATRHLKAALALRPKSPTLWSHLGDALTRAGDEAEARSVIAWAKELRSGGADGGDPLPDATPAPRPGR